MENHDSKILHFVLPRNFASLVGTSSYSFRNTIFSMSSYSNRSQLNIRTFINIFDMQIRSLQTLISRTQIYIIQNDGNSWEFDLTTLLKVFFTSFIKEAGVGWGWKSRFWLTYFFHRVAHRTLVKQSLETYISWWRRHTLHHQDQRDTCIS